MSHSVAGEPPSAPRRAAPSTTAVYSAAEWDLLTGLPARVIVAATAPAPGRPSRGVLEGLAGLDGVAAGRFFDSDLVRAVVTAIYTESTPSPIGRPAAIEDVLAACRNAVRLLRRRADPADSAAYRQWVQSVAARVCRVAPNGYVLRAVEVPLCPADRLFLDRLGVALGLR